MKSESSKCTKCGCNLCVCIGFQRTNPLDKNIEPLKIYAEHVEIRAQVHGEIRKLLVTLGNNSSHTVYMFLNCISPLKNLHDPGRLPVYATNVRSAISDKRSCVWALVSCLVQAYWKYELDDDTGYKLIVSTYLDALKIINEYYPEMKIVGAENKGYWLEL